MIKKEKRFFAELAISSPPQRVSFVKPRSLVRKARPFPTITNLPPTIFMPKNDANKLIHVCFSLYDKIKTYSRFTGTAMLSLFENTDSKVMIHLLHDNTLTNANRDKLIQIANRYGQLLKFYNVEELCKDRFAKIEEYFPKIKESHFSIATFYRFFIPDLLLAQGIEKALYFDSDIIVNMDIKELWEIELGDKPLAATSRFSQIDKEISDTSKVIAMVREGLINEEDYFHAGLMVMNLKVMKDKEDIIFAGMKFIGENPQFIYLDQEILNYCFSTSYLKMPVRFNRVISFARLKDEWTIEKKIYHYAAMRFSLGMDMKDPYNRLFMDYFIKTPWFDAETTAALSGISLPARKNYSVSVIIPMYNAAEFIGECLDSLLIQTFQDFEVIVVDDCSIDNSVAIVESYAPRFEGRLRLEKIENNSGGGGYVPRNIGLMLACGEYIQFIDADDMLLNTALEVLYAAAILHDADVVYTSSYYRLNAPNDVYLYKDGTSKRKEMINIQTNLIIDDPKTNLNRLLLEGGEGNFHNCWTKFVRRNFLIKNKILFAEIPNAGDFLWVVNMYCHARRFLRISTPFYLYRRYNDNSILRTARISQKQCHYWFSTFVDFAKNLYEVEKKNKILAENPIYCLETLRKHFTFCLNRTENARKELNKEELYKVLYNELTKPFDDSSALLLPFLFSFIDTEKKTIEHQAMSIKSYAEPVNRFKSYFTAKIFVRINKKMDEETIQILSVSDSKAQLTKPEWWQRNGTCHMIDSYMGKIEIVAKAMTEGNVQIRLGGPYVLNPKDKSKRIPYWIDYTKLIVNDKVIFDTLTPAWNDKNYLYNLNAKANEEIRIQVEWLPHKSEDFEQKLLPPPPKVKNPIPNNFMPFITARMEIKLMSKEGDFQIQSVSDSNANVTKPEYLQKGSICYCVHSHSGKIEMVAKSSVAGQVRLLLRSMDIRDPKDNKRLVYWLDYTNLVINGETIFDTLTPVWYDKPYGYNIDVKANEEVKIRVKWLPHKSDDFEQKLLPPPTKVKNPIPSKFMPFITARMEIKLMTKEGDFQIQSVSDSNARVTKPEYLQKGSICYCVHAHRGKIEMVAKSSVAGQVRLLLRSMDIRSTKDNKRLAYWLDYTNLVINGKTIFDTLTPVWYDKFYGYNIDVKADEEINIQVEWLPHKSDT